MSSSAGQAWSNGDRRLVLDSVGLANASALRAVRQVVTSPLPEVAKLVYQAPSTLADCLRGDVAEELARLLNGLGFRVSVTNAQGPIQAGKGEFEAALVVTDIARLSGITAETAAFLGTDLPTARRMVCRTPAVLLSGVSAATVAALRERFAPLGAAIDAANLSAALYYAVIVPESKALYRGLIDLVKELAPEAPFAVGEAGLTVSELTRDRAQALWERLHRLGVRTTICNRELERYDVSLTRAPNEPGTLELLAELGIPARVFPRLLRSLPVVVLQNAPHAEMLALLDRVTKIGGEARGIPYSFQRFSLVLQRVPDPDAAAKALVAIGEVSETEATVAARDARGARVGAFSRTTALWLQHLLAAQAAETSIELA